MEKTNLYSETLLTDKKDSKDRNIAFQFNVWECEGAFYANVQKGFYIKGDFVKFGARQRGKKYSGELSAIKGARMVAKQRIAAL